MRIPAEQGRPRRVDADPATREIGHPEQVLADLPYAVALARAFLDAALEGLVQHAKLRFDPLGLGDVVDHAAEAQVRGLVVAQVFAAPGQPAQFARIRPGDPEVGAAHGAWLEPRREVDQGRVVRVYDGVDGADRKVIGGSQSKQGAELRGHGDRPEAADVFECADPARGLRDPQFLLEPLLLVDVDQHAAEPRGPVRVGLRRPRRARLHPPCSLGRHDPVLLGQHLRSAQHAGDREPDTVAVLRVDDREELCGAEARGGFLDRDAVQRGEPGVAHDPLLRPEPLPRGRSSGDRQGLVPHAARIAPFAAHSRHGRARCPVHRARRAPMHDVSPFIPARRRRH